MRPAFQFLKRVSKRSPANLRFASLKNSRSVLLTVLNSELFQMLRARKYRMSSAAMSDSSGILTAELKSSVAFSDFRFVYASGTRAHFEKAAELFNSAVKIPLESDIAGDLIRYFRARSIWNSSEFRTVSKTDLLFFNEAKHRFAGDRFEALFKNWKAGRIAEAELRAEFPSKVPNRKVYFETYLVPKQPDFRAKDDESG